MRDLNGQFIKGNLPWNKGSKGVCKANSGTFKKGRKFPIHIESKRIEKVRSILTIKPILNIDTNLAYMLGLLKGDGFVYCSSYTNGKLVVFQNTELCLVKNFSKCLKRVGLNPNTFIAKSSKKSLNKKISYRTQAYSKIFYEWYKNLDFTYLKEKLNNEEKIIAFLKGFYEAEGSLHFSKRCKYLQFTNTNLELINFVKFLLEKIGFNFHLNGPYKSLGLGKLQYYNLKTGVKKQIINFIKIVEPSIKNKVIWYV